MKAKSLVTMLMLSLVAFVRAAVSLEPDARWQIEFPDLPDTLATVDTDKKQPARLTVQLPANYARNGRFPLFVFLNGGTGGRGDTLPIDRQTIGSNDFICANLPLFKRAWSKADGGIVTIDDFATVSRAYRVMLERLFQTVPNISPERSAIGGFSNGAHTTALLLAGGDDLILERFRSFYFIEGGSPLAANALHRESLKICRFLWMQADQSNPHLGLAIHSNAKEQGLDFTFLPMQQTRHEFPERYRHLLGQWIRGENVKKIQGK